MAKMEMHKLEENATFNLNKKKGIVAERKEAKIEIDEAERYRKLQQDLVCVYSLFVFCFLACTTLDNVFVPIGIVLQSLEVVLI